MREILFRGKRIDNGEWVYGYLVKRPSAAQWGDNGGPWYIDVPPVNPDDSYKNYNVDPDTVGQYIGIRENGSPIFEGDIVRCRDYRIASIEFVGKVGFKDGSFVIEDGEIAHFRWVDYEVDVIGNIYDTPALMKGATEHETD